MITLMFDTLLKREDGIKRMARRRSSKANTKLMAPASTASNAQIAFWFRGRLPKAPTKLVRLCTTSNVSPAPPSPWEQRMGQREQLTRAATTGRLTRAATSPTPSTGKCFTAAPAESNAASGNWYHDKPATDASDEELVGWFRGHRASACFQGQPVSSASDVEIAAWFRGQPATSATDAEIARWFRDQPGQVNVVNLVDCNGNTALHDAVVQGNNELVLLLLDAGADVTAENTSGQRPSQLAMDELTRAEHELAEQTAVVNKRDPNCLVGSWSTDSVVMWMQGLQMGSFCDIYSRAFATSGIDGQDLVYMDDQTLLRDFQMATYHRNKVRLAPCTCCSLVTRM